jgi:hypothetical protein
MACLKVEKKGIPSLTAEYNSIRRQRGSHTLGAMTHHGGAQEKVYVREIGGARVQARPETSFPCSPPSLPPSTSPYPTPIPAGQALYSLLTEDQSTSL